MLNLTLKVLSECIIAVRAHCLRIEVQNASITSDALIAFADAARCGGLASLKILDFKLNHIGPAGATALAEAMWTGSGNGSRLPWLEVMNLGHNSLGDWVRWRSRLRFSAALRLGSNRSGWM